MFGWRSNIDFFTPAHETADKSQPFAGKFAAWIRNAAHFAHRAIGVVLVTLCGMTKMPPVTRPSSQLEIAIGWSLAACCHPIAAWRVLSRPRRYLLAGAYGAFTYVAVLSALLLLS
jgi:hypothetical protein